MIGIIKGSELVGGSSFSSERISSLKILFSKFL